MAIIADNCPWQALVDRAYDRWESHNRDVRSSANRGDISAEQAKKQMWSFGDMLSHCDHDETPAVLLGKLNQQIDNGGIMQWVENGYATDTQSQLAELMPQIGQVSITIWNKVETFLNNWTIDGEFRFGSDEEVDELACEYEAEMLDKYFYKVSDEWHREVYDFIAKRVD